MNKKPPMKLPIVTGISFAIQKSDIEIGASMIGGGAEKPVERAFDAVADSRRSRCAVSQRWT